MKFSNLYWKAWQSIIGFTLFFLQARYMQHQDLAVFTVAQSLILIVPLLDFGIGVHLTNSIVKAINHFALADDMKRRSMVKPILLSERKKILVIGMVQSLIFGIVFLSLTYKLSGSINYRIFIIFIVTVYLHSIGLNLGRIFVATGDIVLLVKLQSIGAFIAFIGSTLAINTSFALSMSIAASSFSSMFLGISALIFGSRLERERNNLEFENTASFLANGFNINNYFVQLSQLIQVVLPVIVQYLLVSRFSSQIVVTYFACQKIVNSVGNIFGSEIQLNYSIPRTSDKLKLVDVTRFKLHLVYFLGACTILVFFLNHFWKNFYGNVEQPSMLTFLSFVPLSLLVMVDQAIRYRLYGLENFRRECLSILFYFFLLVLFVGLMEINSILFLNLILITCFILKFIYAFSVN